MDTQQAPAPATPPPAQPQQTPAPASDNHTLMGILCYLGVLVLVPYLTSKEVPFVKFHIKQGLSLAIIEVIAWLLSGMFWGWWFLINLVQLGTLILSIVGIVNVVQKKEKELPLVGSFAKSINI